MNFHGRTQHLKYAYAALKGQQPTLSIDTDLVHDPVDVRERCVVYGDAIGTFRRLTNAQNKVAQIRACIANPIQVLEIRHTNVRLIDVLGGPLYTTDLRHLGLRQPDAHALLPQSLTERPGLDLSGRNAMMFNIQVVFEHFLNRTYHD